MPGTGFGKQRASKTRGNTWSTASKQFRIKITQNSLVMTFYETLHEVSSDWIWSLSNMIQILHEDDPQNDPKYSRIYIIFLKISLINFCAFKLKFRLSI